MMMYNDKNTLYLQINHPGCYRRMCIPDDAYLRRKWKCVQCPNDHSNLAFSSLICRSSWQQHHPPACTHLNKMVYTSSLPQNTLPSSRVIYRGLYLMSALARTNLFPWWGQPWISELTGPMFCCKWWKFIGIKTVCPWLSQCELAECWHGKSTTGNCK